MSKAPVEPWPKYLYHTKGEWKIDLVEDADGGLYIHAVDLPGTPAVAIAFDNLQHYAGNAKLIAAAPRMLEVLISMVLCAQAGDTDSLANASAKAEALINKICQPL